MQILAKEIQEKIQRMLKRRALNNAAQQASAGLSNRFIKSKKIVHRGYFIVGAPLVGVKLTSVTTAAPLDS